MRSILEERSFPVGRLRLSASSRSAGRILDGLTVEDVAAADLAGTYQSASGAGQAGIVELEEQSVKVAPGSAALAFAGDAVSFPASSKWAAPLAFNVVPTNYVETDDGYTDEEHKLVDESRKILH